MSNTILSVEQIEEKCREIGVGINDLCHEARINRSILVRWKKEQPKSFQILGKIHDALERLAADPMDQNHHELSQAK